MQERTMNARQHEAADELAAALASQLKVTVQLVTPMPSEAPVDLIVDTNRGPLAVEVKSKPSSEAVWATIGRWETAPIADADPVLIADWLGPSALAALARARWSWFDRRRGQLHLDAPRAGLTGDYEIPPAERGVMDPKMVPDPFRSAVGRELAVHLLLAPPGAAAGSVRLLGRALGRSSSSVHAALVRLKEDGLVTDDGEPLRKPLFEGLRSVWRPRILALAGLPEPGQASVLERAPDLNLFGEARPGWALTNTRAASAWGAPVVAGGDYPPDFYVPTRRSLRWAVQQYGHAATWEERRASVAVAPVPAACVLRYDATRLPQPRDEEYLLTHPLFVALDLAVDATRGQEVLAAWRPDGPDGFRRAW